MKPQDLLRFHPFVGALGERDADALLKQAVTRRFQADDVIFRKDDPGTGLYGVVSGRVVVVADSAKGKELILNVFGPGEYFGEIALLDGEGRTATAIAREPSELLFLDRQHFMPFLALSPEATTRIIRLLCKRLRRTTDLVEDSIFLPVSLRLAKQLLALVDVYGLQAKEQPTFPVSRASSAACSACRARSSPASSRSGGAPAWSRCSAAASPCATRRPRCDGQQHLSLL
jgi:CRP-like cAMP-binding protein